MDYPNDNVAENRKRPHSNSSNEDEKQGDSIAPITQEGEMPQKKFYRSRAHCNPLSHNDSFTYPLTPDKMDWRKDHYPNLPPEMKIKTPNVLDVGCGFGGLTIALSTLLKNDIILGLEIRAKVTEYVRLRILACRKENPGQYDNASVLRTNFMKYAPNYFNKGSIDKIFFCFPDPHFKKKNHCRRIISTTLLSEYAYLIKPGGKLYCVTDVKELHDWHVEKCDAHPLYRKLSEDEMSKDPCVDAMTVETEEGKKVERAGTAKHYAVYERIPNNEVQIVSSSNFFYKK